MALINCEECGKEISDKAETCPNCGYKNKPQKSDIKEDIVKEKPKTKSNKKKFIIILIISVLVIALVVGLVIFFIQKNDDDSSSSSDKQEFADTALSIVKAAETAYVDNQETGDKAYTVSYLREKYISSLDDDFEGCIIVKSDEDGNIDFSKKIYLTDGKYMTIGSSSADISSNYNLLVDEYQIGGSSSSWNSNYNYCVLGDKETTTSEDAEESSKNEDNNKTETKKSEDKSSNEKKYPIENNEKDAKKADEKSNESSGNVTVGMKNALKSAKSYLSVSAFSRKGLIEQLEYEKYTNEEATYAVDNCGADWNDQALKSAKSYLRVSAFSYKGLKEQLEYEGFTSAQAKYGADNSGANWNEQAAKSAKSYLSISSFSRNGLIDQLEYEGYTHDQAVYGVDQAGL